MYVYAASSLPYMIQHQINQYPLRWKNDNDDDKNEQSNKNMQISVKCTQKKITKVCERKLENMKANGQQLRWRGYSWQKGDLIKTRRGIVSDGPSEMDRLN